MLNGGWDDGKAGMHFASARILTRLRTGFKRVSRRHRFPHRNGPAVFTRFHTFLKPECGTTAPGGPAEQAKNCGLGIVQVVRNIRISPASCCLLNG